MSVLVNLHGISAMTQFRRPQFIENSSNNQSNMFLRFFSLIVVASAIIFASCNKSTSFGSDLLGDQTLNTILTDTVKINMKMVQEDSILTSDPNSIASYFLCGKMNDPVLGASEATVYTGLQFSSFNLDFALTKLDSVVLYLGVDGANYYGDTNVVHEFEATLLDEHPSKATKYYSSQSIAVKNDPNAVLGRGAWLPTPRQGRPLIDSASTVRDSVYGSWLSFRLSDDFGKELLLLDSATLNNDTLFWAKYKGLQIKSKTEGAILGLNLNNRTFSRITLYYKKDTLNAPQRVANLQFIGENKFVQLSQTPSSFFSDRPGVVNDDFLAVQGMTGKKIEVEVPFLQDTLKQNWSINTAELLLYVASYPGDNLSKFTPPKQLSASFLLGDTVIVGVADLQYSSNLTGDPFALFGGKPVEVVEGGNPVKLYKLALPSHLQEILLKRQKTKFFVTVSPAGRSAERLIFHSPGSVTSAYRSRLNIRYTLTE